MYGIVLLALIYLLARLLNLNTLIFILQYALAAIIVAIPVVFQPELRNALVKLGQTKLTNQFIDLRKRELETVIEEIVESSEILSKQKAGAIIVLARYDKLKDLVERGKALDARLSTELILNIFTPKAPLHDGAIVISGSTIKAAGVILPLSESKFNYHLGTRHRAAIGLSSVTDAIVIVISGETGQISMAIEGILESPLKSSELKKQLYALLRPAVKKEKTTPI